MTEPAPVTLSDMRAYADAEAFRIQTTQEAWVKSGLRAEPDAEAIRKQHICEGICRMIDRIHKSPDLLKALKA